MSVNATKKPIVVHADGTVTVALTHKQLLKLETWVAQPTWDLARDEALEVLHQVRM